MAASLSGVFNLQSFTDGGLPLASGRLYTYTQGTTTHKVAYTDQPGAVPHTYVSDGGGGLYIALDARGELPAPLYLTTGSYDIALKRADGSSVWTRRADPTADSAATVTADLADTTDPANGDAMIGVKLVAAGSVGRTQHDKNEEGPLSVEDFRSPGYTDQQALVAWAAAVNALQITGDAAGFGGAPTALIPNRTYTITADFTMPNGRIHCLGKIVTGAFKVQFINPRRAYCQGLSAETVLLSGGYFSTWVDLKATTVTIDGYATGYGFFWNTIKDSLCDIVVDLSKWSVNQNLFENGRGRIQTTGATGSLLDGHMNNTVNWDFTSTIGGYTNTSTVQQNSTLINAYVEGVGPSGAGTANISGPVNILGLHGDVLSVPPIGRRNHILFTGDVSERCHADFIPISSTNLVVGGEWDQLDTDASGNIKPVGFYANPHFQASTVTDATEPFGMGQAYGGTFTQEFSIFQLTLPAIPGGKFALVLAYKGDDFSSIYVDRGGGDETYYGTDGVDIDGTWKLYRVSGNANSATTTTVNFFITSGPGVQPAKTTYVGGCIVTPEKVAPMPSAKLVRKLETNSLELQGVYDQYGTQTKAATAAVSNIIEVAVTFPKVFSAAPTGTAGAVAYSIENTDSTNGPKMSKHWIKSGSVSTSGFTVAIYTVGVTDTWQGIVHWHAKGPQ